MTELRYAIIGRVVLEETGAGIGGLSVVLLETDDRGVSREPAVKGGHAGEAEPRRVASSITGAGGLFRFQFGGEDAGARAARSHGLDVRIVVTAPGITDEQGHGQAELASVSIPRVGRQEAIMLRVPSARLAQVGVRPPTDVTRREDQVQRISSALANSEAMHAAVREVTDRQAATVMKRVLEPHLRAREVIAALSLSRFTAETRSGAFYVAHDAPVWDKLDRSVADRMKEIPERLDARIIRKIGLRVDPETLRKWNVTPPDDGAVAADVPFVEVVERVRKLVGGGPLERSRSWLEIACAERSAIAEVKATISSCTDATPSSPTPEPSLPAAPTDATSQQIVRDQVARQLAYQTAPELELEYGVPAAGGAITATITKSGPADVTAFHDFHDLQIAFEHVWSEAFDERIPKLFRDVYAEMVKFSNKASGLPLPPLVENVSDMRDLYDEFRSMVDFVEAADKPEPQAPDPVPDPVKQLLPQITDAEWTAADISSRTRLTALADEYIHAGDPENALGDFFDLDHPAETPDAHRDRLRNEANVVYATIKAHIAPPPVAPAAPSPGATSGSSRLHKLFEELDQRLAEPYRFDIFARDSINAGIMLTYRQRWVPLDYQVGSLVSTVPLGPKEVRRYSTKTVVKKTRAERDLVDQEHSSRSEQSSTSRADSEIVRQARERTSFEATASGTINVGVFQGQFGTKFGVDSEKASSDTKKNFREAVLKAADEFRRKHTTEVQISTSEEVETTSSGEVSNPNDEITVTYLFYELQRQYEISELLHRLTPVVLVANDVPRPHEVDEDWLISNQWILQRALLDESLRPALQYLTSSVAGDQLALEALRANVERQVRVVEETTRQMAARTKLQEGAFEELKTLVRRAASVDDAPKIQNIAMTMFLGPLALAGGGGNDDAEKRREDIAKLAVDRADQAAQQVTARLTTDVTALQEAIDKYVQALRAYFDHALAISALRIHVKQNILYYMQAIWDHEPPDQRYFRLYNVPVPWIVDAGNGTISANASPSGATYLLDTSLPITDGETVYYEKTQKRLSEVADLDNLLGYKGNYMIFPAKEPSYLHLYMMQDYIDPSGGLRDPDGVGTMSSREILDGICCLQRTDPPFVEEHREELTQLLKERMAGPRRESDLVVVPTDSLYIEALPGAHPVMEQFKRVHRALDVKKVQAEVRHGELENLRLAARLLEGERGDPEIEKVVEVREGTGVNVNT